MPTGEVGWCECRCWCVNSAGKPVKIKPSAKRFYYLADAIKLMCPTIAASNKTSSTSSD